MVQKEFCLWNNNATSFLSTVHSVSCEATPASVRMTSSQIHSPWLGDMVDSGIWVVIPTYVAWQAGRTTLCRSQRYPQSETMNLATARCQKYNTVLQNHSWASSFSQLVASSHPPRGSFSTQPTGEIANYVRYRHENSIRCRKRTYPIPVSPLLTLTKNNNWWRACSPKKI